MKELLKLLAVALVVSTTYAEETKEAEHKDAAAPEAKHEAPAAAEHHVAHINRAEANKFTKALAAMQTPWKGPMATIEMPACCAPKAAPKHKAAAPHHAHAADAHAAAHKAAAKKDDKKADTAAHEAKAEESKDSAKTAA